MNLILYDSAKESSQIMDKDLYEILGIKKEATESEIRKAYLKLAKKYHPDVNPGDKVAEQKFKEINLAYEVLKDEKKRTQYDQMRAMGTNPFARARAGAGAGAGGYAPGPEGFDQFGLGDLFEEIFGSGGFRKSYYPTKGHDRESTLQISFMEAVKGGERLVQFSDGKRLTVKIPSGVDDGMKIKLSGQGDPGISGGPAGDLILILRVAEHPFFKREGHHIILKLPVTFSEAVKGSEIEVPTIDGMVHLKIPSGISSGQRLKLSGKGIVSTKSGQRGDQYVEVLIKMPKELSEDYKKAADLVEKTRFNPREGFTL
ncbi:MAG: DnaJ C-terminal domain-containing protein [Pseudomonadota bacterium]